MKRILFGLLLAVLLAAFCGCNGFGALHSSDSGDSDTTTGSPSAEDPTQAAVRILNTDPALEPIWTALAEEYTRLTGVEATVVSKKEDCPTLRSITSAEDLPVNCADLSQTSACAQLISQDMTLRDDQGRIVAVADQMEVYGLMYNSALLAQTANTREDINSFTDLTEVVYGITDAKDALGFSAFVRVDSDGYFILRLAALNGSCRNLVDLILHNTTLDLPTQENRTKQDALTDFVEGNAVFFLAGPSEQAVLSAVGTENIGVLPIYTGGENEENHTLCIAPRSYWCVDATGEEAAKTVDFLDFLTTPRSDGTVPVDDLQRTSPYRHASFISNTADGVLRRDLAAGKEPVVCRYVAQVPSGLEDALAAYAADPSDANWASVCQYLN